MNNQTPYTYVFVRKDIPIHAQLVQPAHACLELGFRLEEEKKPKETSYLILLQTDSEKSLLRIAEYLEKKGIKFHMLYEPDYNMGYTSLCCEPVYDETRNIFRKFSLWEP